MVRLLRSSFDCSNVIKSELVGQDFTWWHTPQEVSNWNDFIVGSPDISEFYMKLNILVIF